MSDVLLLLADKIKEAQKAIETDMALGHLKDISEYKFAAGRYRGFLTVIGMMQELVEEGDRDDD